MTPRMIGLEMVPRTLKMHSMLGSHLSWVHLQMSAWLFGQSIRNYNAGLCASGAWREFADVQSDGGLHAHSFNKQSTEVLNAMCQAPWL